jgi:F1F0 ATPase subunit 2
MTQIHESWLLAGLVGIAIGAFFFGSLWWTVQRSMQSEQSMLWHFGGLLLRMSVTLTGFYAVGAGQWQRLAACLVGFVIARFIIIRITRSTRIAAVVASIEVKNAP